MSSNKIASPLVLLSMFTVAALAAVMALNAPDRAWAAAIAAGFLPTAWVLIKIFGGRMRNHGDAAATHSIIRVSMLGASLVLGVALAAEIAQMAGLIPEAGWDMEELIFGFSITVAMIVVGIAFARAKKDE